MSEAIFCSVFVMCAVVVTFILSYLFFQYIDESNNTESHDKKVMIGDFFTILSYKNHPKNLSFVGDLLRLDVIDTPLIRFTIVESCHEHSLLVDSSHVLNLDNIVIKNLSDEFVKSFNLSAKGKNDDK